MKTLPKLSLPLLFAILALTTVLSGCKSTSPEIPMDITEAELLQMAQSSIDKGNKKTARYYYNAVIAIFGSSMASVVIAEFELAHMDIKEKKFTEAKPALERIISYYDDPQFASSLPPEYKTLAEIDLAKCE